ncbi:MAG: CotH kinase family protein, partial [Bacteroidota bacterium]
VKMVSPCLWGSEGEQLLHRERLAYELYQQITPYSFQTYSTEIAYHTVSSSSAGAVQPVFFLEPKQDLYARLDVEKVTDEVVRNVSGNDYGSFVLFQYFIGNTDWNLSNRHNLVLVKDIEKGRAIPIPYDFDQSGLVNAPYAKPYPTMPIEQVTDRMLQWRGKNKEPLLYAIQQFQALKPALIKSLLNNTELKPAVKAEMEQFLKTFFLDLGRLVPEEEWAETPKVSKPLAS